MPNNNDDFRGFLTLDGRGGPCLISPEESKRIAEFENIKLDENSGVRSDYKWVETVRNIEATLPESERAYHRKHMNQIATDLGKPLPFPEDVHPSKSYVRIVCEEDAIPRFNIIQLRNTPPTKINLKGGENILPIEAYPDLMFGFTQIDDFELDEGPDEWNGYSIKEIDLSHFKSEDMIDMSNMFGHMANLEKIIWSDKIISNVVTALNTFERIGNCMEELDLRRIDFSKAIDLSEVLYGCASKTINMAGCNLSKVKEADDMFTNCTSEKIILDNSKEVSWLVDVIPFEDGFLSEVSLKGCDEETIRAFAIAINESGRDIKLLLDKKYDYKVTSLKNGKSECLIIKKTNRDVIKRLYDIKGTVLRKSVKDKMRMAIIPEGVTEIATSAFEGLTTLECVFIPSSVKIIGDKAFKNCNSLVAIHVSDSVEKIGSEVFSGCTKLKHLYLPDSVKVFDAMDSSDLHLHFLRIPFKLLFTGCMGEPNAFIDYLTIGLPKDMDDLGKTWNGWHYGPTDAFTPERFLFPSSQPYVIFESYEDSHFSTKELISIDGIVIGEDVIPSEEEDGDELCDRAMCAYRIPNHSLAIPSGVERLEKFCVLNIPRVKRRVPLFIPESVYSIDPESLEWGQILITPARNYSKLKQILPACLNSVWIVEV